MKSSGIGTLSTREQRHRANGKRTIVIVVPQRVYEHYFGRDDTSAQSYINTVLEREIDQGEARRGKR